MEAPSRGERKEKIGGDNKMSIAKIDIDLNMDEKLLSKFIETRIWIISALGYRLVSYRYRKTKKGYHFWFHIDKKLSDKELCDLQFLLGDDINRCKFNYLRLELGSFNTFNALFSKKLKFDKWDELYEIMSVLPEIEGEKIEHEEEHE